MCCKNNIKYDHTLEKYWKHTGSFPGTGTENTEELFV